ncbi:MAG: response regulator [Planctomycetes bacterium]|nr:response regulator [Planctomycetota bacterium]
MFTTGEAAEVCRVSQQTIIRCFDAGRLTGFRVPGSKFRRIPREDLIRFMKANNIPLDALESPRRRVLVVDDDPAVIQMYQDAFGRDPRLEIRAAASAYDAGILTESFRPALIILDYMLPDLSGAAVCSRVRGDPRYADMKILCVSGVAKPEEIKSLVAAGADAFLKKPFDFTTLMDKVTELLALNAPPRQD